MSNRSASSRFDGLIVLTVLSAIALVVALWAIFGLAPRESTMGIVQKIFYFHVPSAILAYVGFFVAFCASVFYLLSGRRRADVYASAGAEVGVLFCAMVIMSGPLWARKAWGVWWTGEPRLMLTLVLLLVFLAYVLVRRFGGDTELTRRICAVLAILGVVDIPLVRYSVMRWRGNHPQVITGSGGGIAPEMLVALVLGFVFFTLLFVLLFAVRVRQGNARLDAEVLQRELSLRVQRLRALEDKVES